MQKVLMTAQLRQETIVSNPKVLELILNQDAHSFESFEHFSLMAFNWYDVTTNETGIEPVTIYIDSENLLVICREARACRRFAELLQNGQSNERALYLMFVSLLSTDMERLDKYENEITNAEEAALHGSRSDYLDKIYEFRRELLRLKRYYEQLSVILDHLFANDNQLLTSEGERGFGILLNRVKTYCSGVNNLRDYVTQMREAWQAQLDLEQNNLMRVFTVITAVFLPLTLIVGWYGMNFSNMPLLHWRYGYPVIILLAVLISVLLLTWFKRKKWF